MSENSTITTRNLLKGLIRLRIKNHQDIGIVVNQFKNAYASEEEERNILLGSTVDEMVAETLKEFTEKKRSNKWHKINRKSI